MKFNIHATRPGSYHYWPVGTVEAADRESAVAEAVRQFGEGHYVADLWHPPFTGPAPVTRYAPSRMANGRRWR